MEKNVTKMERLLKNTDDAYLAWRENPDSRDLLRDYQDSKSELKTQIMQMRKALETEHTR